MNDKYYWILGIIILSMLAIYFILFGCWFVGINCYTPIQEIMIKLFLISGIVILIYPFIRKVLKKKLKK